MRSKPQLLIWLTCDAIHVDQASGKYTVLGVFSGITSPSYPITHNKMVWLASITDVNPGNHRVRISIGMNDQTEMTGIVDRAFESRSPLHRINLVSEISNLTFPKSGDYSIMLEIDDEPLLLTSLTLG